VRINPTNKERGDIIHRISQKNKCVIYKIIAKGTIDEYIDKILDLKADIAKFTEGDKKVLSTKSYDTMLNKKYLLQMLGGEI